jgi:hypothetical protein
MARITSRSSSSSSSSGQLCKEQADFKCQLLLLAERLGALHRRQRLQLACWCDKVRHSALIVNAFQFWPWL